MSVTERPPVRSPAAKAAGPAPATRRADIQALRALAVGAVVVEHFWPNRLTGGYLGVDVFFVISGFLITGHLVRELSTTGRIRLGTFWMRRVRRLLPAALVVVAATALLSALTLPQTQWPQLARHMLASTVYVQNWALAAEASDYFARSVATSPLMHLWSLSVEEQFYLVWPLLLIAAAALARRRRAELRSGVTVAVLTVGALSLLLAVVLTPSLASAYYSTPLRAWEFAVGALCALLPVRCIAGRLSAAPGAAAAVVLVLCIVVYTPEQGVPGAAAILPVLATGAIILLGPSTTPRAEKVLGATPIRWLGASSYAVYLWHWPLLITATALGGGALPLPVKMLLLVLTCVLAHLTRTRIEQRFIGTTGADAGTARSQHRRAAAFVVSSAVMVCALAVAGTTFVAGRSATAPRVDARCLGAAVLEHAASCDAAHARPDDDAVLSASAHLHVGGDRSGIYCIQDRDGDAVRTCSFGARAATASARVALVGDSHAGQWVDPLAEIARERGWHVDLYLKSSCPAVDPDQTVTAVEFPDSATSCAAWRSAIARSVQRGGYDVVVTSAYSSSYAGRAGIPLDPAVFTSLWRTWISSGTRLVVLADTPRFLVGFVPDCISATPGDDPCTAPVGTALKPDLLERAAEQVSDRLFTWVDLNAVRCDSSLCHTVLGGMVTVGDRDHMTTDFARSLTPLLSERLARVG